MEINTAIPFRVWNPFDDSAVGHLRRMGLLTEDGKPDRDILSALCCVYAGLFFENLCDFYQDVEVINALLRQVVEESEQAEPKQRFLMICLQYDAIYQPLPDPIWWISGNLELADRFSAGFFGRLRQFIKEGM